MQEGDIYSALLKQNTFTQPSSNRRHLLSPPQAGDIYLALLK
jgi:hypothetical protein